MRRASALDHLAWPSKSGYSLIMVAVAAALFGTEGLLRRPLLAAMSPPSVVLAEHLLLALVALPIALSQRRVLARLPLRTWCVLFVIGVGASGCGALLFTKALEFENPTTASLLQNTQPIFVVFLAIVRLKERLARIYWPCLLISIAGAYLLSFGTTNTVMALDRDAVDAAGFALGAAALWASGTVLARLVLGQLTYVTLTAMRILFALPFLWIAALSNGDVRGSFSGLAASPLRIGSSALIPGLVAVLLFYRGLQGTKACYAVLGEFMYPAAALLGNWLVLGAMVTPLQALGCLLLIATVLLLSRQPSLAPAPKTALGHTAHGVRAIAFAERV